MFDFIRQLKYGPVEPSTTLVDEVSFVTPIEGSIEAYAPQGDQGSKDATDQHLAEKG